MRVTQTGWAFLLLTATALIAGCGETEEPEAVDQTDREIVMHYNPQCGCCGKWAEYMSEQGFDVTRQAEQNINAKRRQLGVPDVLASCHTAVVDGYVIEGHVPADEVRRLLVERPEARGLSVPRMPLGSPGMEVDDREDEYDVVLFREDGSSTTFARYRGHTLLEH